MPPTDTSTSLGDHQYYGGDGEDDGDRLNALVGVGLLTRLCVQKYLTNLAK